MKAGFDALYQAITVGVGKIVNMKKTIVHDQLGKANSSEVDMGKNTQIKNLKNELEEMKAKAINVC